ncbi:hypothetical protein AB4Z25_19005 [Rhizobium sp. RAF36]|uniref:hypothetical protein n=1 Tax=Rhizobium sp. RAF36 TaxID=3233055 RepID=UPI0013AF7BA6
MEAVEFARDRTDEVSGKCHRQGINILPYGRRLCSNCSSTLFGNGDGGGDIHLCDRRLLLAFGRGCITFSRTTRTQRFAIMSGIEIFAFIVLPAIVAAGGWIAVLANEHSNKGKPRPHPGE